MKRFGVGIFYISRKLSVCVLIVAFISRTNSNVLSLDCFVLYFAQLELSFHFIVTLTAFYFVNYVYISPIKLFFHFDFFFFASCANLTVLSFDYFFCILCNLNVLFLLLRSSLAQIYLFSKSDCFVCILRNLNVLFFIVTFVTRANLTVVSLNCCVCIMRKLAVISFHCYLYISRKFSCSFLRLVFT